MSIWKELHFASLITKASTCRNTSVNAISLSSHWSICCPVKFEFLTILFISSGLLGWNKINGCTCVTLVQSVCFHIVPFCFLHTSIYLFNALFLILLMSFDFFFIAFLFLFFYRISKQRWINMIFMSLCFMSSNLANVLWKLPSKPTVLVQSKIMFRMDCAILVPKIHFWWSGSLWWAWLWLQVIIQQWRIESSSENSFRNKSSSIGNKTRGSTYYNWKTSVVRQSQNSKEKKMQKWVPNDLSDQQLI